MLDATIPATKLARSVTIVGIVDVVFGGLGLAGAGLITVWSAVALFSMAWSRASAPAIQVDSSSGASLSVTPTIIVLGFFALATAFAQAWLLATGIRLLRRSRHARRAAIVHAGLMLLLGTIAGGIALESDGGLFLAVVLSLTAYAVAQAAAFFALPSWRELGPHRETSASATT